MKIMGIDPGTLVVGYSILEDQKGSLIPVDWGAIRTSSKEALPLRLKKIYENLTDIISKHVPQAIAIEKIFIGKNMQTAIRTGEGRGIALLSAAYANVPIFEYDATVVKKSVAGIGNAHKSQVQRMVQNILNLSEIPTPTDAGDALAIAICHYHHMKNYTRL